MITPERIRKACEDLAQLLIQKNHDYGNSVQEQYDEYGMNSILIRLDDKTRRLKNLNNKEGQVTSESTKDTLTDTAGYAILGLLCLEIKETKEFRKIEVPNYAMPAPGEIITLPKIPDHVKDYYKHGHAYVSKSNNTHAYFDQDDQH